jgi:hypothetical protein
MGVCSFNVSTTDLPKVNIKDGSSQRYRIYLHSSFTTCGNWAKQLEAKQVL